MKPLERRRWKRRQLKRKAERKKAINLPVRNKVTNLKRTFRKQQETGDKPATEKVMRELVSAIDKAAKKGLLHPRTADRRKSRLAKQLAKMK
ncbi:MAG: 30S ribosomal protein S20, partial [Pedosphaera sp.]|nr:30S ribosomal protein S20 [Pedosphaera sp.]MSU44121.1 30S ribosomal protein S20 [Pedosphaera sp.]